MLDIGGDDALQFGERLDVALDEQDALLVVDRSVDERDAAVDALCVQAARAGWGEDGGLDAVTEFAQLIDDLARRVETALSTAGDNQQTAAIG